MSPSDQHFRITAPVLLLGFNRPEHIRQVFQVIRAARPTKLYFAADGPRTSDEQAACDAVRALTGEVDWPCELRTRFSPAHAGLRTGVSSAISWFFAHETEGIVLEDDTLPVPGFFRFCQEMLDRYRNDERIWVVMGNNLMDDWQGPIDGDYYFSAHGYGAPWGWASWRRVWQHYDVDIGQWPLLRDSTLLRDFFLHADEQRDVIALFDRVHSGAINSWSYQLDITRIANHALNILPRTNLIDNIGFGEGGTHTVKVSDPRNKRTAMDMDFPVRHPRLVMCDGTRDAAYYKRFIGPSATERFKEKVRGVLPKGMAEDIADLKRKLRS